MSNKNYVSIAISIVILCLIFFCQLPLVEQQRKLYKLQLINLETQKKLYEYRERKWRQDSTRRAHEIEMLDSALYRIKKIR